MINKPFSESCEQNKDPILSIIKRYFVEEKSIVLEIGSGTGQHAAYFPHHLSHLSWQPSDTHENLQGIEAWQRSANLPNTFAPVTLDVSQTVWPVTSVDYIFSANTVHIMSWQSVKLMMAGIRKILKPNGIFCLYGPFNYDGQFSSPSNAQFDLWLKARNPESGVRDFEALCELANQQGSDATLKLINDHDMPANNRILVFQKQTT